MVGVDVLIFLAPSAKTALVKSVFVRKSKVSFKRETMKSVYFDFETLRLFFREKTISEEKL